MQEPFDTTNEKIPATAVTVAVPPPETKESFFDFIRFVVLAALIVIPIRLFVAQPFIVSGNSMIPSYQDGNYLIIDELSYRFAKPERGDVIVFRFPMEPSKFLIKRIAALPGETIQIHDDTVTIRNSAHPDGFVWKQGVLGNPTGRRADQSVTLGADDYFVLGDNRGESADSRLWGPLPREFITGRPILRLFPLTRLALFPGKWSGANQN